MTETTPSLTAQMRELETKMRDASERLLSSMAHEWLDDLAALTVQIKELEEKLENVQRNAR